MAELLKKIRQKVCAFTQPTYSAMFPEYHYEGIINDKQIKAYEKGGYFHLEVQKTQPTQNQAQPTEQTQTGQLEKIVYHAVPQTNDEDNSTNQQKAYDPKVVMVDYMKGDNITTKLGRGSNNPRVHTTLKTAQTNFDTYLEQIYKAKTADLF